MHRCIYYHTDISHSYTLSTFKDSLGQRSKIPRDVAIGCIPPKKRFPNALFFLPAAICQIFTILNLLTHTSRKVIAATAGRILSSLLFSRQVRAVATETTAYQNGPYGKPVAHVPAVTRVRIALTDLRVQQHCDINNNDNNNNFISIRAHHRANGYCVTTNTFLYCTDISQQNSHYSKKKKLKENVALHYNKISTALLTNNASALWLTTRAN